MKISPNEGVVSTNSSDDSDDSNGNQSGDHYYNDDDDDNNKHKIHNKCEFGRRNICVHALDELRGQEILNVSKSHSFSEVC